MSARDIKQCRHHHHQAFDLSTFCATTRMEFAGRMC